MVVITQPDVNMRLTEIGIISMMPGMYLILAILAKVILNGTYKLEICVYAPNFEKSCWGILQLDLETQDSHGLIFDSRALLSWLFKRLAKLVFLFFSHTVYTSNICGTVQSRVLTFHMLIPHEKVADPKIFSHLSALPFLSYTRLIITY